ncbi:MAG: LysM peptidoglycan-binding domain-containing protein [Chloroflexota bacterium]
MAVINSPEINGNTRPERTNGRPQRGLGERLLKTRLSLHLAVFALVGTSALAAHDQPLTCHTAGGWQPPLDFLSGASAAPTVEALARSPLGIGALAASPSGRGSVPGASARPSPSASSLEPSREALLVALDLRPELSNQGQQDGVVAVRAMASSRGGARAPEPAPTAGPSPTPTPTPRKEPQKPLTYKVVAGDTLLGIAYRFGITPETILWANDLGNGEMLQIGQDLTILPVSGVLHEVKKGETLSAIAEAYGAETARVVETNGLADVHALTEGQALIIPGGMLRTTEPITGLPSAPSQQELASAPKYVVKDGDTLLSIADGFGVRASVIQVANGLLDPDRLKIGQALAIPGGKAPAATTAPAPRLAPAPAPAPAAPEPAPAPAPAGGGGDQIAAISQKYLGYRYVWGGTSPASGFDCSGFVWYVYKQAGISIPRAPLGGQLGAGPRVSRDQLLPGDLIFWQNTYTAGLSHVGIYLGGGRFINAESEAVGVQIRSLNDPFWSARFYGASRPW